MCQHFKDRAKQHRNLTLLGLDCSAKVDTDFPIGAYFKNRFSIGDKKRSKLLCTKAKKNSKKKCPIVQIATIGHQNR